MSIIRLLHVSVTTITPNWPVYHTRRRRHRITAYYK